MKIVSGSGCWGSTFEYFMDNWFAAREEWTNIHTPLLSCFSYRYEKGGSQELRLHNQRCCSLATFPIRKELPAGVDRWSLAHGVFFVEDGCYLCAQPSRICLICYCWFAGIGVWICVVGEMEDDLGVWREGWCTSFDTFGNTCRITMCLRRTVSQSTPDDVSR